MESLRGSPGVPLAFASVLQAAREAGMDVAPLRALRGDEAWRERRWIWAEIMRAVRADGFPIRVAQRHTVGNIGELGMAVQSAPDLRSALECLLHHHHLLTGTPIGRVRDDLARGTTIHQILPLEGTDLAGRCRREMYVASGLKLARDVSGVRVRPLRVSFAHAAPRDRSEHEEFFDCEIHFNAGYDGLEFDRDTLAIPLPGADGDLSQFFMGQLRATGGNPPEAAATPEGRVRQAIYRRLGNETLAMPALARDLGMGPRTLRRRLQEHGTHYQEILDRVRREVAEELLGDPDHKLSEIASILGFSDASAFHRAYVRWTGRTPAFRRRTLHRFVA